MRRSACGGRGGSSSVPVLHLSPQSIGGPPVIHCDVCSSNTLPRERRDRVLRGFGPADGAGASGALWGDFSAPAPRSNVYFLTSRSAALRCQAQTGPAGVWRAREREVRSVRTMPGEQDVLLLSLCKSKLIGATKKELAGT
ncbi:unnamed protein product [Merluccius merluccius]